MKNYEMWMQPERFNVVAFYPYTSIVCNVLFEQSHNSKTPEHDFIEEFGKGIKALALEKGMNWDNKVVVEIRPKGKSQDYIISNLFVGFKDDVIKIGLGVWMPDKHYGTFKVFRFDEP